MRRVTQTLSRLGASVLRAGSLGAVGRGEAFLFVVCPQNWIFKKMHSLVFLGRPSTAREMVQTLEPRASFFYASQQFCAVAFFFFLTIPIAQGKEIGLLE